MGRVAVTHRISGSSAHVVSTLLDISAVILFFVDAALILDRGDIALKGETYGKLVKVDCCFFHIPSIILIAVLIFIIDRRKAGFLSKHKSAIITSAVIIFVGMARESDLIWFYLYSENMVPICKGDTCKFLSSYRDVSDQSGCGRVKPISFGYCQALSYNSGSCVTLLSYMPRSVAIADMSSNEKKYRELRETDETKDFYMVSTQNHSVILEHSCLGYS